MKVERVLKALRGYRMDEITTRAVRRDMAYFSTGIGKIKEMAHILEFIFTPLEYNRYLSTLLDDSLSDAYSM